MHVEHLMPACIDQRLHHEPGQATPTELFKGEDPVYLVPVLVQPAPGNGSEPPVDKCAENPVLFNVGLLLVIVVPDFFNEREFVVGKFTGQGGWTIFFTMGRSLIIVLDKRVHKLHELIFVSRKD